MCIYGCVCVYANVHMWNESERMVYVVLIRAKRTLRAHCICLSSSFLLQRYFMSKQMLGEVVESVETRAEGIDNMVGQYEKAILNTCVFFYRHLKESETELERAKVSLYSSKHMPSLVRS
uniref:Uncharacterized protein n=1 Tax=Palpitomonas bilix TaxID=652834 RepID=A0A7S3D9Z3_9EUKA|mmetsp:Transcript_28523/g.72707  ORF Transcript_28523/g.72707 Transcript_28523/m.72707 type:complete len:120 (+) Transcript_28523:152-511(+)